jgi:hypothetical protein
MQRRIVAKSSSLLTVFGCDERTRRRRCRTFSEASRALAVSCSRLRVPSNATALLKSFEFGSWVRTLSTKLFRSVMVGVFQLIYFFRIVWIDCCVFGS